VVGVSAARGFAQFLEDFARRCKRKVLALIEAPRQITDDFRVAPGICRWIDGALNMNDTALGTAGNALLFFLKATGENHVGISGCFRQEEVAYRKEFELLQCFA